MEPSPRPTNTELDAIVNMLTDAGLLEMYTDDDGSPAYRLTQRRAQVGRAMAMAGDDVDPEAVLNALLDASQADTLSWPGSARSKEEEGELLDSFDAALPEVAYAYSESGDEFLIDLRTACDVWIHDMV